MTCVALASVVAVGVVMRDDGDHRAPRAASESASATPAPLHTVLLAHVREDGATTFAVLLATDPDTGDTSALQVPANVEAQVPSLGLQLLRDVTRLGDAALLPLTVANLTGLRIDEALVLDTPKLNAALAAAGPVAVTLRNPVRYEYGTVVRKYPEGPQTLAPDDLGILLVAMPAGGERDHLEAARSALLGWTARLADPAAADALRAAVPSLAPIITASIGTVDSTTLPVTPAGVGDEERFALDAERAEALVAERFASARLGGDGERVRVEVRNGTGGVAVSRQVAELVIPTGATVTLTGNVPGFGVPRSEVLYYRDRDAAAARAVAAALAITRVRESSQNVTAVEVSVIIGADFAPPPS